MGLIDDLGLDDPLACVRRSTSGQLKPAAWGSPSSVEKDLGRLDELLFMLFLFKFDQPRRAWTSSMWNYVETLPI
jgi:hypothetical protein